MKKLPETVLLMALTLTGCAGMPAQRSATPETSQLRGYSGIAPLANGFLVVHDAKLTQPLPRFGFIAFPAMGMAGYQSVPLDNWSMLGRAANDLESLCALPGRDQEYLAAESGHYLGLKGHLLHIRVAQNAAQQWQARLLNVFDLPAAAGSNFEGLVCAAEANNRILIILGERGGSSAFPEGLLRLGSLAFSGASAVFAWSDNAGATIPPPVAWRGERNVRSIADLALDIDGQLWAVATRDTGDAGPFESRTRQIGRLVRQANNPLQLEVLAAATADIVSAGLKIEGLTCLPDGRWFMASDDELYGGIVAAMPH